MIVDDGPNPYPYGLEPSLLWTAGDQPTVWEAVLPPARGITELATETMGDAARVVINAPDVSATQARHPQVGAAGRDDR